MDKLNCNWCGTKILPLTADSHSGLCLPCSREVVKKWKAPPSSYAYYLAAIILLLNALLTGVFLYLSNLITTAIVGIVIDLFLSRLLIKHDLWARTLTIARASIGIIAAPILLIVSETPWVIEGSIVQLLYSTSLNMVLLRDTKKKQLIIGTTLASVYFIFFIVGIVVTNNA